MNGFTGIDPDTGVVVESADGKQPATPFPACSGQAHAFGKGEAAILIYERELVHNSFGESGDGGWDFSD